MRFHAVYRRLYFWLGSALVALMDAPPLGKVEARVKWVNFYFKHKDGITMEKWCVLLLRVDNGHSLFNYHDCA